MTHAANACLPMPIESASDTYRVVILDGTGTKVRVVLDGDRSVLPSVAVPRWQRIAENLTDAVKNEWGEEVICLLSPSDLSSEGKSPFGYEITEFWRTKGTPRLPMRWELLSEISQNSFADKCDYLAVVQGVARCNGEMKNLAGTFTRLGWFHNLREWVESAISPSGLRLNGNFRQLNASPSFSLVRFETNSTAVWFKAVGEPNQREFPITCALAELFPSYLPPMLGVRPEWNGWLSRDVVGINLYETENVATWEQAATALARLQIESMDYSARVLTAGARDQTSIALSGQINLFMETMALLMEQQCRPTPQILSKEQLRFLRESISDALGESEKMGIPDTLGQFDLNPGNLIVSLDKCTFLDWAEAFVGNPLFSFQYLLEHFRRVKGVSITEEARISKSFSTPWIEAVPPSTLAEAFRFVPLLAVFAYAIGTDTWVDEKKSREPLTAAYLRSLTRRMYREAQQLTNRKTTDATSNPMCSGG